MIISAKDYKAKFYKTAIVALEDGVEFEIKRISPVDFWESNALTDKNPSNFIKTVVIKGVINPRVALEEKDDALNISHLTMPHLSRLADEILKFSGIITETGEKKDFLSPTGKE